MKKYFPLSISLCVLIIVYFLWERIKLPYNDENLVIGEYYLKKFNPANDLLRFFSFVLLPCLIYLVSYLKFTKKTYSLNPNNYNYFLGKKENNYYSSLNFYFIYFIILISVEFLSINFLFYISEFDEFHDAGYLVPPLNYLKNKEFFISTFYDYGLIGNNLGLISNFFLGYYTWGSIIFIKLLLIYGVKFSLVLISKKIIAELNLNKIFKTIFFIVFTFWVIALPDYYDYNHNYFSFRHLLYLIFIFVLGTTLCENKILNLKYFFIGTFSLISVLWWVDIGTYINLLIILSIIYLIVHKEIKNSFLIIFGIIFSWSLFFLVMPAEEIKEFLAQVKFLYSDSYQYLLGIEFRKPFSLESGRWTKALMLMYISGLMIVNLNFSQKFHVSYKTKIFINLLFVSAILIFNSALIRSDDSHLRYTAGLYSFIFVLLIVLFLFQRLNDSKKIKNLMIDVNMLTMSKYIFLFYTFLALLFFVGKFNKDINLNLTSKIQNVINHKLNILQLLTAQDDLYLNEKLRSTVKYYKEISEDDSCVLVFSEDAVIPYLLGKPACTQFVFTASIIIDHTESKFIEQLVSASPNFILFKSPTRVLLNYSNMPNAVQYISDNYSFYKNYNEYVFYKKN
jgi:hypothetical protein